MRQLLVAYDGSPPSRRALVHAADLAQPGDAVTVVNVMPEPGTGSRIEPPARERNRQRDLLDEARRVLAGRGIEARTAEPVGDAATEILVAAERIGADVIVVARRRGRIHTLLGSVCDDVVRSAACDVLVVHEGPAAEGSKPG